MPINAFSLPPSDQIFTHFNEITGKETVLAASRLNEYCKTTKQEIVLVPVTREGTALMYRRRGIEKHRLQRLAAIPYHAFPPLLYLAWDNQTHLLVDGSHRYVSLYTRGHTFARAWLLTKAQWEPFVVEGLPSTTEHKLLNSFSGIR